MGFVIAVANEKGGIGKSSVAETLADGLSRCGFKTLLIDADPQCNSTTTFHGKIEDEYTMLDIFENACTIKQAIQHTNIGDIVPGDKGLKNREGYYSSIPNGFFVLSDNLEEVKTEYDMIIIDTPPNIGTFTTNALVAADGLIIPTMAQSYSIDGVRSMFDTVISVQKRLNNKLQVYGVLINAVDNRNSLDKNIIDKLDQVKKDLNIDFNIFNTRIRTCQDIKNSQDKQQTIFTYAPKCTAAVDYVAFIKELLVILGV